MAKSDEPHTFFFDHFDVPEPVNLGLTVFDFTFNLEFATAFGGRFLLKVGLAVVLNFLDLAFESGGDFFVVRILAGFKPPGKLDAASPVS